MEIDIKFTFEVSTLESLEIQKLKNDLKNEGGVTIKEIHSTLEKGNKDGGLLLGLTISSGVVAIIDMIINWINYLKAKKENYSISFQIGEKTFVRGNISYEEFISFIKEAKEEREPKVNILVAKQWS